MFALIAVLCFILALFGATVPHLDFVVLGLTFVGLHLAFDWRPWRGVRDRRIIP